MENATEIPELKGKNINEFKHGISFVLALTKVHKIYSWGANDRGQLGQGFVSTKYAKPAIINLYVKVTFVQISCGEHHAMALTSDGNVYAWGDNNFGQIISTSNQVFPPISRLMSKFYRNNKCFPFTVNIGQFKLNIRFKYNANCLHLTLLSLPRIKSIYSSNHQSFAITTEDQVYCWGLNHNHKLATGHKGHDHVECTKIVNIGKIVTISSSHHNTYFLDEDGHLYFSGRYIENGKKHQQKTARLIEFDGNIKSLLPNLNLHRESKVCALVGTEIGMEVHYLEGNHIIKTDYRNYLKYCAQVMQTTPENIHPSIEYKIAFKSIYVDSSEMFLGRSEINSESNGGSFYLDQSQKVNNKFVIRRIEAQGNIVYL